MPTLKEQSLLANIFELRKLLRRQEFINRLENFIAYESLKADDSGSSIEQSRVLSRLKSFESKGRLVIDLNLKLMQL